MTRRNRRFGERGQIMPLAAVIMVAMVGMLAIAVDTGMFLITRRELQNAADAGALAGIVKMPDDATSAHDLAAAYVNRNTTDDTGTPGAATPPSSTFTLTNPAPDEKRIASRLCEAGTLKADVVNKTHAVPNGYVYALEVTARCKVAYSFGRILGLTDSDISATGIAAVGSLLSAKCPAPWAVADNGGNPANGIQDDQGNTYSPGDIVEMKVASQQADQGNFHSVDLTGKGGGGAEYRQMVAGQDCVPTEVGQDETGFTKPGDMVGPLEQGLKDRGFVANDINLKSPTGQKYDLICPDQPLSTVFDAQGNVINPSSVCLVVVPVLSGWDYSGAKAFPIEMWAMFCIQGYVKDGSDHYLDGAFVKMAGPGDLGAYNGYGPLAYRLIG